MKKLILIVILATSLLSSEGLVSFIRGHSDIPLDYIPSSEFENQMNVTIVTFKNKETYLVVNLDKTGTDITYLKKYIKNFRKELGLISIGCIYIQNNDIERIKEFSL